MMDLKMEIIIGIICFVVGGAMGFGVSKATEKPVEPIIVTPDPVAKQLGKLDVVEPICHPDFIDKQGDGLCKLLMCMTQTNSATGETSGQTCDNISNVENKKAIMSFCMSHSKEQESFEKCVDLFFRRGS
jgi:hypothetical protein